MGGKGIAAAALLLSQASALIGKPQDQGIVRVTTSEHVHPGELANVHLDWHGVSPCTIKALHGSCQDLNSTTPQTIGDFRIRGHPPQHLAWAVPDDAMSNNCIYVSGPSHQILGKSDPVHLTHKPKKRSVADLDNPLLKDFDALGTWFDGVAAIKQKTKTHGGVASSHSPKEKKIAIVGAGISGLATGLMLDSVGLHNWEIIEASDRVGGRFRTKYMADTDEWAEMGPMRLPYSVTYKDDNETLRYTDHELTFQMAETLNDMNKNDSRWKIDFIPWIQHHPNELIAQGTHRHPDGRIPTRAEIEADPSLNEPSDMLTAEYNNTEADMDRILKNEDTLKSLQRNVWLAHKTAMDEGLDDWSEQAMMRHVFKASENVTDEIWTNSDYDVFWDELHHNSNLGLDGTKGALGETNWLCIDGGFNRLSDAFLPHVRDRLTMNRQIRKLEPITSSNGTLTKTRLSWYPSVKNRTYESADYDYTIMAVPFTMTRFMDLPSFSSVLSRAISEAGLHFKSACKVALLFSERFWEKGPRPIFGGYSKPPSDPIGALYHPVYGLNESRPGLIMHYRGGDWSDRFVSFSDEEHVQTVLDSIVSLHGEEVRDLYTGDYERLCWLQDEHTATAWCRPDVEQHKLYIPSYHVTEHNTIFIGEHTAPTHAWVSSSLQSAVRGTVQLLLELGLVDEAKEVNRRWMGRWIKL
ncbi:flavin monoamine oxidase family protein [Aspergillus stella-maris]|uniref:flavin monoamine oxidase family protein n=1 Tax=Aspergillus stella-maris TaxID=1810926 RepID=UPI003CCE23C2